MGGPVILLVNMVGGDSQAVGLDIAMSKKI